MKKCKVLKLAGGTGLRMPGTLYRETDEKAARLEAQGVVEIVRRKLKESKTKLETKEEKHRPSTKARSKKTK